MHTLLEAESEAAALKDLEARGATDGLPVVLPTEARVEAMVQRVDMDPDLLLGVMGPAQGAATVHGAAIAAVMAGCAPDHFPVVVAAIRAICRPEFDLTEIAQTTHPLAPLLVVNGPAREACGPIGSGNGVFAHGSKAGLVIGRAVSLAQILIGGRKPGITDMACFSAPGNLTACVAEAEDRSPFTPLHVAHGFDAQDSVITAITVDSPQTFIVEHTGDAAADSTRILRSIANIVTGAGSLSVYAGGRGVFALMLNPEHAGMLSKAGFDRASIAEEIMRLAVLERKAAEYLHGPTGYYNSQDTGDLPAMRSPDQMLLFVGGGPGTYSAVFPTWGFQPHAGIPVSEKIEVFPTCPTPFGN